MQEHDILIGKAANGNFLRFGGGEHAVLHARSGAGKSVGFSIPNAFTWKGSLVCLDIKPSCSTSPPVSGRARDNRCSCSILPLTMADHIGGIRSGRSTGRARNGSIRSPA